MRRRDWLVVGVVFVSVAVIQVMALANVIQDRDVWKDRALVAEGKVTTLEGHIDELQEQHHSQNQKLQEKVDAAVSTADACQQAAALIAHSGQVQAKVAAQAIQSGATEEVQDLLDRAQDALHDAHPFLRLCIGEEGNDA